MKLIHEGFTPGAMRALSKLGGRVPCANCGFALPRYPGRYPKHCPQCDVEMSTAVPSDAEAEE